jgi:hypothetical protein
LRKAKSPELIVDNNNKVKTKMSGKGRIAKLNQVKDMVRNFSKGKSNAMQIISLAHNENKTKTQKLNESKSTPTSDSA